MVGPNRTRKSATLLSAAVIAVAATTAIGPPPVYGQEGGMRGRILDMILVNVMCCSTDIRFSRPADAANVPDNLGIAVAPGTGGEVTIHIGRIVRGADGKPAFSEPYSLASNCRPMPVIGAALAPRASFYTVAEIAARTPKDPAEKLWPVVNATFQSSLLSALKLPSSPARHTCLRQHLERVIHGEEGSRP
jgi:hypothetical protein